MATRYIRHQTVVVIAVVIMPVNIRLCESPDPVSESLFLPVARKSTNSAARLERHQMFLRKCNATAVQESLLPLPSTRKRPVLSRIHTHTPRLLNTRLHIAAFVPHTKHICRTTAMFAFSARVSAKSLALASEQKGVVGGRVWRVLW